MREVVESSWLPPAPHVDWHVDQGPKADTSILNYSIYIYNRIFGLLTLASVLLPLGVMWHTHLAAVAAAPLTLQLQGAPPLLWLQEPRDMS